VKPIPSIRFTLGWALLGGFLCLGPSGAVGQTSDTRESGASHGAPGLADAGPRGSLQEQVPFFAQTTLLCGGAAAAMLERFWGRTGAYPQDFAHLVRASEGGIRYADLIQELEGRGWDVRPLRNTPELAWRVLDGGVPVLAILKVDDRLHYLVLLDRTDERVFVHDPALGPSEGWSESEFMRGWEETGFRGIVLFPSGDQGRPLSTRSSRSRHLELGSQADAPREETPSVGGGTFSSPVPAEAAKGPADAMERLRESRSAFDREDYALASELAARVAKTHPGEARAWRLLGASRYMEGRPREALSAWNRAGRPRVDLVELEGITTLPQARVLERLGVRPGQLLTPAGLRLAQRRTGALPTVERARSDYRPRPDGSVVLKIRALEKTPVWEGWMGVAGLGIKGLVGGRIRADVPGLLGEGENLSVEGRWREDRPVLGAGFSAPSPWIPGVTAVSLSWGLERYLSPDEREGSRLSRMDGNEEWIQAGVSVREWLGAATRGALRFTLDRWKGRGRFVGLGGGLFSYVHPEVGLSLGAHLWNSTAAETRFSRLHAQARWRTHPESSGLFSAEVRGGVIRVSRHAPRNLWPGAGSGVVRPYLLRAHPLTNGAALRQERLSPLLFHAGAEIFGPGWGVGPFRMEPGGLVDLAHARSPESPRWDVDVGLTSRITIMGTEGRLQLSLAHGLADGQGAFSLAWREPWWPR